MRIMNPTKFFLFINLSLFSYLSFSQAIKSYSGSFENGTATYQYIENDKYERVYHGPFSYKSGNLTLIGKFSDDKKHGDWKATNKSTYYKFSEIVLRDICKWKFRRHLDLPKNL